MQVPSTALTFYQGLLSNCKVLHLLPMAAQFHMLTFSCMVEPDSFQPANIGWVLQKTAKIVLAKNVSSELAHYLQSES